MPFSQQDDNDTLAYLNTLSDEDYAYLYTDHRYFFSADLADEENDPF